MKNTRWMMAVLAATAACGATAQTKEALYLRSVAATCAQCHGTDGRAVGGSAVPPLAGLAADYTSAQLKAFKAGTRPATIMHQLARGYSDAQIDQIAGFFAAQKK